MSTTGSRPGRGSSKRLTGDRPASGPASIACRELTIDPALKELLSGPKAGKRGGTVPACLQAQIANYSAGLDRLMSGGGTLGLF